MTSSNTIAIKLVHGDIVDVEADVCVTSVHRSKDMTKGPLASHILRHGGQKVNHDLRKVNGTRELDHGQAAMISSGNLACKFKQLMVVCLYCWRAGNDEALIISVSECLEIASQNGFKSIVFPALGMGGQSYPPFNVAMAIMTAIANFRCSNPESTLQTVNIALYDKDENSIRTFLQTSIAYITGTSFKGDSDVDLQGTDDFNGLESTKPRAQSQPSSNTMVQPTSMNMVNFASALRDSQGISPFTFSRQAGDFEFSVSPNLSMRQRSLGLDLQIGFNFGRFLPSFINWILPGG